VALRSVQQQDSKAATLQVEPKTAQVAAALVRSAETRRQQLAQQAESVSHSPPSLVEQTRTLKPRAAAEAVQPLVGREAPR
jgi:hypothetical protein